MTQTKLYTAAAGAAAMSEKEITKFLLDVREMVRCERISRDLSLRDVAKEIHISAATLSRIENGNTELPFRQLVKLERFFEVGILDTWEAFYA